MIEIRNLNYFVEEKQILCSINLTLPNNGLIAISGKSGSGKTTLLNCITGLLDFEGTIIINGVNISTLKQNELDSFRLKEIGFIFQDFKLFANQTIKENILLPLGIISDLSEERKKHKLYEALDAVNLNNNYLTTVDALSGGEKQKVTIARALINNPSIIVADEPTGSLDSKNSKQIMNILKNISKNKLVILVSHNDQLVEEYCDEVYTIKDGKITNHESFNNKKEVNFVPISNIEKFKNKHTLPYRFLIKYSKNKLKKNKWRTYLTTALTSVSLLGVGISFCLSNLISNYVKSQFDPFLKDGNVIISTKDESAPYIKTAAPISEVYDIYNKYKTKLYDVGFLYTSNFENIFKDRNEIALASSVYRQNLEKLSMRNINEFKWLDCCNDKVYPNTPNSMKDDEVILGLDMANLYKICSALRLEPSAVVLSNFMLKEEIFLYFDIANNNWEYSDQLLFKMIGFTIVSIPCIYHLNHSWNEVIFEDQMMLPTSDYLEEITDVPWEMKKIPYLMVNNDLENLLISLYEDEISDNFLYEIENNFTFPLSADSYDSKCRLLVYLKPRNLLPLSILNKIKTLLNLEVDPMIYNDSSYSIYPSNLISGFSNPMFLSFEKSKIDDIATLVENEPDYLQNVKISDGMLEGHFTNLNPENVRFLLFRNEKIDGFLPQNIDEICISSTLANKLNLDDPIGKQIYFVYCLKNVNNEVSVFNLQCKISGIITSKQFGIYQNNYWPIVYFQKKCKISIFELMPKYLSLKVDENNIQTTIKTIHKAFPNLKAISPSNSLEKSIDETTKIITSILLVFALLTSIVSIFLQSTCNYLHIYETRKEIALSRCIGTPKKETTKFSLFYSLTTGFRCYLFSVVELVMFLLVMSLGIMKSLNVNINITTIFLSLFIMLVQMLFISIISTLFISKKYTKLPPLEALKK